jgi:hypothetical protein
MKEAGIGDDQPLIADDEAPKVPQPGARALHNPPPPIAAQLTPLLVRGPFVVSTGGHDGLNTPPGQPRAQGMAVITPSRAQALGPLPRPAGFAGAPDGERVEGRVEARDFRRGRRLQVCSQRRTRAIDQNPPLRPLAACRRADLGSPFWAGIKLPSAKHASQRRFCASLSGAKKARQSLSRTPVSSHS